ncbi:MAG: hypothetical protein BJ554DRAFT_8392, partial [Olpidium bornovanus]
PCWSRACPEIDLFVPKLGHSVRALVDNGSEITVMESWIAKEAGLPFDPRPGWTMVTYAGENQLAGACPDVEFKFSGIRFTVNVFLQEKLGYSVILGQTGRALLRCVQECRTDGSETLTIRSLDDRERREVTTVRVSDSRHKPDLKSEKGEYAVRDTLGAEEDEGVENPDSRDGFGGCGTTRTGLAANFTKEDMTRSARRRGGGQGERACGGYEELCFEPPKLIAQSVVQGAGRCHAARLAVPSVAAYERIRQAVDDMEGRAAVRTMYKTVDKKVRPAASEFPATAWAQIQAAKKEPGLRPVEGIGHHFTEASLAKIKIGGPDGSNLTRVERAAFLEMVARYGHAFAFEKEEIGCVNPEVIAPMVIFTVDHVP